MIEADASRPDMNRTLDHADPPYPPTFLMVYFVKVNGTAVLA